MSKLIIVESPTKTKTIKEYLGKDYTVVASMGHVRDLPAAKLNVDVKNNFEPKYAIIKGKENLVRDLQKEWRDLGSCGLDEVNLQKDFREICDDFFSRRRDQLDIQEQARQNNLQKKILLCEQAEDLLTDLNEQTVGGAMNKVKHLRRLWKEVGAVPRSESDKVWKRFNSACDQVFAFGRKDEAEQPAES